MDLGFGLIFLAGLVSFLSPCVLALIPVYVGLLGGDVSRSELAGKFQLDLLLRTLSFAAGFSLVFIFLGMTTTLLGDWLYQAKEWIARIGGVIVVLFGLHITGLITIPFLDQQRLMNIDPAGRNKFAGAFLMGIAFSAGWSPCIGPILGSVLAAIMVEETSLGRGALALAVYSTGMALPFILISLGMGKLIDRIRHNTKLIRGFQIGTGILLVIMGFLLVFGITSQLNRLGLWFRI